MSLRVLTRPTCRHILHLSSHAASHCRPPPPTAACFRMFLCVLARFASLCEPLRASACLCVTLRVFAILRAPPRASARRPASCVARTNGTAWTANAAYTGRTACNTHTLRGACNALVVHATRAVHAAHAVQAVRATYTGRAICTPSAACAIRTVCTARTVQIA